MGIQRGIDKVPARHLILTIWGMLTVFSALAGPVGLPDSARPGAVRPEQEERAAIPQGPSTEVMEIPAVIDRPFDIDDGERIIVQEFRLIDAEDMPEYDINIDEIKSFLQAERDKFPEGFTVGRLQEVADNVESQFYRKKGLILAQVVVPVQTVQSGIVDLQVFVGKLGRVLAEGNEMYSSTILEQAFKDLIGKPINKSEVEAALLRLTDYPGLTIFGVFQPGQLVGTADIVLKVQEEKRFDVAMRVDDHGTRETGRNRFRTVIDWNNITGGADRLTLSIQQAYNPKNNVFFAFDYERFLGNGYKFLASFNRNKFDIGGEFKANQIHAESWQQGLLLEKSFIRSRVKNLTGRLGFWRKESTTTTAHNPTNKDRLSVFTFGVDYDSVDTFSLNREQGGGGINFATIELSQGLNNFFSSMGSSADALQKVGIGEAPSRQGGPPDNEYAPGMFTKLFATYTRLQTLAKNQNLLFRAEWQWSDDILVPLEQYTAGGPDNVRSHPVAQILWDRAYFLSFEWLFNAPFIADRPAFANRTWGELFQFSVFYDIAVGRLNEPTAADKQSYDNIRGAGLGFRFTLPGTIESKVFVAWALGDTRRDRENSIDNDIGNERRPQVWGDFTYSF